jgi:hypothetical protein
MPFSACLTRNWQKYSEFLVQAQPAATSTMPEPFVTSADRVAKILGISCPGIATTTMRDHHRGMDSAPRIESRRRRRIDLPGDRTLEISGSGSFRCRGMGGSACVGGVKLPSLFPLLESLQQSLESTLRATPTPMAILNGVDIAVAEAGPERSWFARSVGNLPRTRSIESSVISRRSICVHKCVRPT